MECMFLLQDITKTELLPVLRTFFVISRNIEQPSLILLHWIKRIWLFVDAQEKSQVFSKFKAGV